MQHGGAKDETQRFGANATIEGGDLLKGIGGDGGAGGMKNMGGYMGSDQD